MFQKLEEIVTDVILKHGVSAENQIFKSCVQKLFKVTKIFVMVSSLHLKGKFSGFSNLLYHTILVFTTIRLHSICKWKIFLSAICLIFKPT